MLTIFPFLSMNIFLGIQVLLYEDRPVLIGMHFGVVLIAAAFSALSWGYFSHVFKEMRFPLL